MTKSIRVTAFARPFCVFFCVAFASFFSSSPANAFSVSATDGDSDNFGATLGFAIDFDGAGLGENWTPQASYSVDSLSIFETSNESSDVYLGVYQTFQEMPGAEIDRVDGFLGVADQMHRFDNGFEKTIRTWTFSDIGLTVKPEDNPGAGADVLYFIYQSSPDPVSTLDMSTTHNTARIEGSNGSFRNELSAIIRPPVANRDQLIESRSPEFSAELTMVAVPEPSHTVLFVTLLAVLATRRRRD